MTETTSSIGTSTGDQQSTAQLVHDAVVQWLRTEAGMKIDHVDLDAPLFELGIDSLGVATISCELEQATQKKINLEVVYELETIKELAEYLDSIQPQQTVASRPRRFAA